MKIIVCVKQVPDAISVDIDPDTGVLKREGVRAKLNPYDLYAIEAALRLREEYGGTVKALTMGPPQAGGILREACAMGVDEGFLLTDTAFAGSDVLATSYALAGGIKKIGAYDLVICGKQTTDGDTAQVGPETAEFLDIPHAVNVTDILAVKDGAIRVVADMAEVLQTLDIPLPCLIAVDREVATPRLPSYKRMLANIGQTPTGIALGDLEDDDPLHYGLDGSPTRVVEIYPPQPSTEKIQVEGSGEEIAEYLYQRLKELKFI